jgi:hypothetical protein
MTLPIDKLRAVKTLVCHRYPTRPCPDGTASAIILRDVRRNAEVLFATHGPELDRLEAREGMLFCDIAPPAERAKEFVDAGTIVLDHHRSARSVVEQFGPLGVYADEVLEPGVSGAVLAYREVWKPLAFHAAGIYRPLSHSCEIEAATLFERFAMLAGVRDTWERTSPWWEEACAQAEALAFWPWEEWPELPFLAGSIEKMNSRLAIGPVLLKKRAAEVHRLIREAKRFTMGSGLRVAVIATRDTSDVAEELDQCVDLVVGFGYEGGQFGEKMILSLRSHTTFDCAAFCKGHGGGGHTRAAGCSWQLVGATPQPYESIRRLIAEHQDRS